MKRIPPFALVFTALVAAPVLAQTTTAPAAAPGQKEINALIEQLGGADFQVRTLADKKLREMGWPAMNSLVIARAESKDEEKTSRLQGIMEEICWTPDGVPADVAASINATRNQGRPDENRGIELLRTGREMDDRARPILGRVSLILRRQISYSSGMTQENRPTAWLKRAAELRDKRAWEQLLWEALSQGSLSDVAWEFAQNHGDPERFIAAVRALQPPQVARPAERPPDLAQLVLSQVLFRRSFSLDEFLTEIDMTQTAPGQTPVLADVLEIIRAQQQGNLDRALELANQADHEEYRIQLLAQRKDWPAFARMERQNDWWDTLKFLPAAGMVFQGNIAGAEEIVLPLGTRGYLRRHHAFLGLIDAAVDACVKVDSYDYAAMMYQMQRRYSEAAALIEGAKNAKYPFQGQLEGQFAAMYARLNEVEKAKDIVARFDAGTLDDSGLQNVNRADFVLGNLNAVAARLQVNKNNVMADPQYIFENDRIASSMWAEAFRAAGKNSGEVFLALNELRSGRANPEDLMVLIAPPPIPANPRDRIRQRQMDPIFHMLVAQVLEKQGRMDLAIRCVDQYAPLSPTSIHGRSYSFRHETYMLEPTRSILLAKDSKLVLPFLEKVTAGDNPEPPLLFIKGLLLSREGNALGAKLQQEANRLLGGDTSRRAYLAHLLFDFGESDLARAQAERVAQLEAPVSETRVAIHDLLGRLDRDAGHYPQALQQFRLAVFATFYSYVTLPEDYDYYYSICRNISYCESRAALEQSKRGDALRAAVRLIQLDPEGLELTVPLIKAFRDARLSEQARSLANQNRGMLQNILKDFPNSHLHHYLIARLDITTGMTNEQTRGHLEKARQLAPGNKEYQSLQLP